MLAALLAYISLVGSFSSLRSLLWLHGLNGIRSVFCVCYGRWSELLVLAEGKFQIQTNLQIYMSKVLTLNGGENNSSKFKHK